LENALLWGNFAACGQDEFEPLPASRFDISAVPFAYQPIIEHLNTST
jgi:hypothetical protein